ncbi:MAG: AAA family ATPase [Spirochaetales bacterium]|nr:AAA family ATPase [Spirochaetales bacterium]
MYSSFSIKNYRCFSEFTIDNLERINLFIGKNGIGKTTLLEAFFLHQGWFNPGLPFSVNVFRGLDQIKLDEFGWNLFFQFDPKKTIEIVSIENGKKNTVKIINTPASTGPIAKNNMSEGTSGSITDNNILSNGIEKITSTNRQLLIEHTGPDGKVFRSRVFPSVNGDRMEIRGERPPNIKEKKAIFIASRWQEKQKTLAERYSDLAEIKKKDIIIAFLQVIYPELKDLSTLIQGGIPVIHGDIGKSRLIPIALMGGGVERLLEISMGIATTHDGIVLIDEIENGIHYSILEKVWKAIAQLSRKENVQVFATTHSFECIQNAHSSFKEEKQYDFRVHRIEEINGNISAVSFDKETLETSLDSGWEIR